MVTQPLDGRRILIIVENLPVPFDRRVWQEALTLREAGAQVVVICPIAKGFTAPYECLDNIHIYRHKLQDAGSGIFSYLWEYTSALLAEFRLALKVWRRHGFDVIHACNPPDLIFLVALPYRLFGKKFIFDHHDINPELYEAKFNRRGFFWRALILCERLTFFLADVSIATNNSYRLIALERGNMRSENVFVVRSGPDLKRFNEQPIEPSLKNGRQFLVGYVGVIGEQEGLDLLLESIVELALRQQRQDIQFCIVGQGPALKDLEASATKLGIGDYITFLGRVSEELLLTVLSTSDVCVNPDRVNPMNDKSTMNKIIEYMAIGKPIVQFETTEGRFSAQDASLYASPNDPIDFAAKIAQLLADPEMREKMGRYGKRRVVDTLSWEHQTAALIAAYQKVFAKGS
jgi:glycosyltransferase involved in cell wall biosynthesis